MKTTTAPAPMLTHAQQSSAIQRIVCEHYGVSAKDVLGEGRQAHICRARQVAMSLSRELLGLSTPRLAVIFHRIDHGTILNACKNMERLQATSTHFLTEYMQLRHACEVALGFRSERYGRNLRHTKKLRGALSASVNQPNL